MRLPGLRGRGAFSLADLVVLSIERDIVFDMPELIEVCREVAAAAEGRAVTQAEAGGGRQGFLGVPFQFVVRRTGSPRFRWSPVGAG